MNLSATRYVIVTPARDEEAHLRNTIRSILGQTILPAEWIIVNDGSSDRTGEIIDEYSAQYPWIRAVHRTNRGFRKAGGGVVDTFNDGYLILTCKDWDFIVKLDGDLSFEPNYFESCFAHFEREPRLGVGGGVMCYIENGKKSFEANPAFHVRGATKIYKRACWDAIGGFWPAPGWDTMDEVKASMLGWTTRSFPELHLLHHRHTGAADRVSPAATNGAPFRQREYLEISVPHSPFPLESIQWNYPSSSSTGIRSHTCANVFSASTSTWGTCPSK